MTIKKERREINARQMVKSHRLRVKQPSNGDDFTLEEWEALCAKYDNKCLRCGSANQICADHVMPLSKGGANSIDNIQPLCRLCNSGKGGKHIDYRIAVKGYPGGDEVKAGAEAVLIRDLLKRIQTIQSIPKDTEAARAARDDLIHDFVRYAFENGTPTIKEMAREIQRSGIVKGINI